MERRPPSRPASPVPRARCFRASSTAAAEPGKSAASRRQLAAPVRVRPRRSFFRVFGWRGSGRRSTTVQAARSMLSPRKGSERPAAVASSRIASNTARLCKETVERILRTCSRGLRSRISAHQLAALRLSTQPLTSACSRVTRAPRASAGRYGGVPPALSWARHPAALSRQRRHCTTCRMARAVSASPAFPWRSCDRASRLRCRSMFPLSVKSGISV